MSELVTDHPPEASLVSRRQWTLILACLSVAFALFCSQFGPFQDDYIILRWLRATSWQGIITLDAGPFPVLLGLWKAALRISPDSPQTPILVLSGLVHGLNCYLAYLTFRRFFSNRTALLAATIFAIYRPGNQAIIWAGAVHDPVMTAFALTTFLLWSDGGSRRWLSCATFTAAMMTKTSVILFPCLLLLYSTFFESPGESRRLILRRLTPVFLVMLLIATAVFLNSILRPGYWENAFLREPRTIAIVSRIGEGIARAFILFTYRGLTDAIWPGYVLLAAMLLGCVIIRDRIAAFGFAWVALTLLPTIVASNLVGARYFYLAGPGAVVAIVRLFELTKVKSGLPRFAVASLAIWYAANIATYGMDVASQLSWNRLYNEAEMVFEENRIELGKVGRFQIVNAAYAHWLRFTAEYVANKPIDVIYVRSCNSRTTPCLIFKREVDGSILPQIIPFTSGRFVRWVSVGENP